MNYCDVVCGIRYAQKIGQKAEGVEADSVQKRNEKRSFCQQNKQKRGKKRNETSIHHPSSIITINP
jgi:hypothetical protein